MKLDPHLPQLPSIGELLDHPRVKGVVARINRSTIAQRATGFLDELRDSLAERAGRVEIPTVGQLAERLARRLLGEPPAGGPMINATGVVVGDPELTPPLADAAAQAMMQVASEYHARGVQLQRAAEADLCRLTGAGGALVLGSFDAAVNAVLAATAAGRKVLVAVGAAPGDGRIEWPKLAARHGAILQTSRGELGELTESFARGGLAALLRAPEADGLAATKDLAGIAAKAGAALIDVCPTAGLLNPATFGLQPLESLRERIDAGADLVIADGAGLLGGPSCGVIVGKRALIDAASAHYLSSIASIEAAAAAALRATLTIYRENDDADAVFALPVWQLLSAPAANLKQRAERLATLIAATGVVAAAEPREVQSAWRRTGGVRTAAPSWVIAVRPKTGDAETTLSQLRQRAYPIAATEFDGMVHLDLRSVFPRWDQQLVGAFHGK